MSPRLPRFALFGTALAAFLMSTAKAPAQYVIAPDPCPTPVVAAYAPAVSYYAPATTAYYAPAVSYYAPSTSYYVPSTSLYVPSTAYYAPSTSYYAPSTSYYVPSGYTTTRVGLFGNRVSTYYSPSYYYWR